MSVCQAHSVFQVLDYNINKDIVLSSPTQKSSYVWTSKMSTTVEYIKHYHGAKNKVLLEHNERVPNPALGDQAFHKGRGTYADTKNNEWELVQWKNK